MKKIWLFMAALLLTGGVVIAQSNPGYLAFNGTLQATGAGATKVAVNNTINFSNTGKAIAATLRERNKSVKLYFRLDLGNDYIKKSTGWNFKVLMDVSYQFAAGSTIVKTLTITNNSPELIKIDDVLPQFAISSPAFTSTITALTINDGAGSPAALTGLVSDFVNNNLRLSITLAREFDVDVRMASTGLMSNAPTISTVTILNRLATFSWTPNNATPYPNYEVQVLKLENADKTFSTNLNQISAVVNWDRALKVETQNYLNYVSITIGEGTGYYLWRVRPIGTYFDGGISNSENYGEWSYVTPTGSTTTLNKVTLTGQPATLPYAFHFTDPDQDVNWIYNRVFTEGDTYDKATPTGVKTSEGVNYADGLQRVRQSQKYNSSEDTRLISQSIPDYAGRPALSTIPVPVSGKLNGYKLSFVTNTLGTLYTAAQYDEDNNMADPEKVRDDNTSAYQYYSSSATSSPTNANVPSAEGYPYKRTVYSNDGSNRVVEESGVGKAHSLGTQANGRGRTTRTMFCAPTDDELIRIFGDEAPLAESVLKTITLDQNNVMSVSYTSKEGKTIATALVSENSPNLSPLTKAANNLTVSNVMDQNSSSNGKIVSSRRIAISSANTTVTLSYLKDAIPGSGTICPTADCNFKMRFYLVDLKQNVTYISDADGSAGLTNFTIGNGAFSFPGGWRFVKETASTNTLAAAIISVSGGGNNQIVLNSGEYLFIKEIFSGNNDNYAQNLVDAENEKTKPIIDAIAAQMQGITSPADYTVFTNYMATLNTMITSYQNNAGVTSSQILTYLGIAATDVPPGYLVPKDFTLAPISTSTNNAETSDLTISTGCCGSMSVPIPKQPTCIACDGSPEAAYSPTISVSVSAMTNANNTASTNSLTPYGFTDFKTNSGWTSLNVIQKRAAIQSLVEREFINPLKDKMTENGLNLSTELWKLAPGFSYESLNFMISNMLVSQYYTGSAIRHSNGTWYAATRSGNGFSLSTPVASLTPAYNYDCKKVYEAWIAALELIGSAELDGDKDIIGEFNNTQEEPNAAQEFGDDDDNWNPAAILTKKKLNKAVKQEMNDYQSSSQGQVSTSRMEATTNMIVEFIGEVKPQFAAIIDGTNLPSFISSSGGIYPDEYLTNFTTQAQGGGAGIYAPFTLAGVSYTNAPLLFENNNGTISLMNFNCNSGSYNELYYPYILRPEWMFKYYVYNVFENGATAAPAVNYIADDDLLLPNQVHTDLDRQYNEPFTYLSSAITATLNKSTLCNQASPLNYTLSGTGYSLTGYFHNNWTVEEKNTFYELIRNAPHCAEYKGLDVGSNYFSNPANTLPTCMPKSDLVAMGIQKLDALLELIPTMKSAMIAALTKELVSSCYTIVTCKTAAGQITENDIEIMAKAAINTTTAQVQTIKTKFTSISSVNNTVCPSPTLMTTSYNDGLCNLPSCTQVDCNETILYNDNTIGVHAWRKFEVKLFSDCDQKIIDMLEKGQFQPYVIPLNGCPKLANSKPWQQGSCTTDSGCSPDYTEKTGCGGADYQKYSKTYSVAAGQ